jgi:hypothetical protein
MSRACHASDDRPPEDDHFTLFELRRRFRIAVSVLATGRDPELASKLKSLTKAAAANYERDIRMGEVQHSAASHADANSVLRRLAACREDFSLVCC